MNTILIIVSIALFTFQTLALKIAKTNNLRERLLINTGFTFIASLGMLIYGLFNPSVFEISDKTILLGILFGFIFALTIIFYNLAIASGPLSYTVFYFSASMIIPAMAGIIGFSEPLKVTSIVAVLLFLAAFYFINISPNETETKTSATKKWALFCVLTFLCNGALAVIQKLHQYQMESTQSSGLMFVGFVCATVFYGISYIVILISEKKSGKVSLKKEQAVFITNLIPMVLLALTSLIGNLLLTYLSGLIESSYLFPLVQGSVIVAITLLSVAFYKEKISTFGKIGIGLGIVAIVIINF